MKLQSVISALLILSPLPQASNNTLLYEPDLSDEFIGEEIDSTLWETHTPHTTEHSIGISSSENTKTKNGIAYLWIRKKGSLYTTPWISSRKKIRYGFIEIRAKLANSLANQNLWLYLWTPNGSREIDVFEIAPAFKNKTIFTNMHIYDGPAEQENSKTRKSHPKAITIENFEPTQFNTYAILWTPEKIVWYLNNKPIRQEENLYFHAPMTIIVGSGIHPDWFGIPSDEMLQQPMEVDYIRTWKWVK